MEEAQAINPRMIHRRQEQMIDAPTARHNDKLSALLS